jgi:hypothetical protein
MRQARPIPCSAVCGQRGTWSSRSPNLEAYECGQIVERGGFDTRRPEEGVGVKRRNHRDDNSHTHPDRRT